MSGLCNFKKLFGGKKQLNSQSVKKRRAEHCPSFFFVGKCGKAACSILRQCYTQANHENDCFKYYVDQAYLPSCQRGAFRCVRIRHSFSPPHESSPRKRGAFLFWNRFARFGRGSVPGRKSWLHARARMPYRFENKGDCHEDNVCVAERGRRNSSFGRRARNRPLLGLRL